MPITFDIETGALPPEELPAFDPSSVKLGNTKDPEKVQKKLEEAQAAWESRFALSELTGRVVAIGVKNNDEPVQVMGVGINSETALLCWFWDFVAAYPGESFIGFNSRGFDLPFLFRRSLLHGVGVPSYAIDDRGYWDRRFIDLLDVWRCGDRQHWVKLDDLCAAFGIEGKLEGVSGADFADLWFSTDEEDHQKARLYLCQDVVCTHRLGQAMGV
jgi:predicted PolB exonuclease-like 3'-5' exonuclease